MRRPRISWKLRAALAAAGIAGIGAQVAGTNASFTDGFTTTVTIGTGAVALVADGDDLIFSSTPLAPGDTATATVRIKNDGDFPADVALQRASVESVTPTAGCALADALRLRIVEDLDGDPATTGDRRELVDGALATAPAELAIGELAVAEARSYEFTVTFVPQGGATVADNDNCLQTAVEKQRFSWSAIEARP